MPLHEQPVAAGGGGLDEAERHGALELKAVHHPVELKGHIGHCLDLTRVAGSLGLTADQPPGCYHE